MAERKAPRGWAAGIGVAAMLVILVGALIVAVQAEGGGRSQAASGSAMASRPL